MINYILIVLLKIFGSFIKKEKRVIPELKFTIVQEEYYGLDFLKRFKNAFQPAKFKVLEDYLFPMPWLGIVALIPKGFVFDGASIPRILWSLINPVGPYFLTSVFHDFGYRFAAWLDHEGNVIFKNSKRTFFDKQFGKVADYTNGLPLVNTLPTTALIAFGIFSWKGHRKNNLQIEDVFDLNEIKERLNIEVHSVPVR